MSHEKHSKKLTEKTEQVELDWMVVNKTRNENWNRHP